MIKLLGWLVVLALIVIGVGFVLGWFGVTTSQASGHTEVHFSVNKDKIESDTAAARERIGAGLKAAGAKLRQLSHKVGGGDTLEGEVVDTGANGHLTVAASNERVDFDLPADVPVTLNGATSTAHALKVGDRVTLHLEGQGEDTTITKVEATRP